MTARRAPTADAATGPMLIPRTETKHGRFIGPSRVLPVARRRGLMPAMSAEQLDHESESQLALRGEKL